MFVGRLQRKRDAHECVDKTRSPGAQHLLKVHREAERNDRDLQQDLCRLSRHRRVGVRDQQAKHDPEGKRERRMTGSPQVLLQQRTHNRGDRV